jgi:hypothetical protein
MSLISLEAGADQARQRAVEAPRLRALLLGLVLLGILGLSAELLLLEHTESGLQWIPLGVLAAGLLATVAAALRPSRATLNVFRLVMAACVVAGVAGVILHLRGNIEFELEMYPTLAGSALFWKAAHGATPALAPGALAQLGLLGLAFTYRHPAFGRGLRPKLEKVPLGE